MENTELTITEKDAEQVLIPAVPTTPLRLIEIALSRGADIGTIERLVAMQKDVEASASERKFNIALNKAQSEMRRVATDLDNSQTRSKYASYAALDRMIRPIYTKEGFSLSFNTGETDKAETVRVLCYVSHVDGHTREYHVDMPADGKGAKGGDVMTKTHATGAAMSYGQRYLLKNIFNIAIGEEDTDGNAVGMDRGELEEQCEWILNASNPEELKKLYLTAYKKASELKDSGAMRAIMAAKDKRKKELA